ncbi:hypothetical protein KUCAC02_011527 [Chaenocephalus aceratus]|uniref:Uncharacterized protein n=1 Tax=Chaenocephalus aceratus TaxID=36190 RepID=A0ACB9WXL6_CHAAC|nr:hypothetical protein KUCAC02_011527 [Chaenocephalus aceratus]
MERISVDESGLQAVEDYCEYRRIVGDDDGGRLFTPEEYEEYKRKVLPQRLNNRLYVSFGVPGGIDCKQIGPETQCFCTHRYKQHMTDFEVVPSERPLALPCQDHSEASDNFCKKCSSCSGFNSSYTCGCGQPSPTHQTLVETKLEREARGQPIGKDVPYAAMGGLTGFSSLLDGYLALEASGSDSEREDGCQQSCAASRMKKTSTEASGSIDCKRETNKH